MSQGKIFVFDSIAFLCVWKYKECVRAALRWQRDRATGGFWERKKIGQNVAQSTQSRTWYLLLAAKKSSPMFWVLACVTLKKNAKKLKNCPKRQKIAKSGHTG
jgi:hypothetical protein